MCLYCYTYKNKFINILRFCIEYSNVAFEALGPISYETTLNMARQLHHIYST